MLGGRRTDRALYGHPARSRRASLWNLGEGDAAETGPALRMSPIDVGDVTVIGAGAVGSAFAYWIRQLGHVGHWVVVDHDRAELHNTNRCLGMIAADAGWAGGSPGGAPAGKAQLAASLMDAEAYDGWYHEWVSLPGRRPDLVLPLANEFDVRRAIGQRGEPVLIHATTSPNWTAELHRHLARRDGCIDCRLPQAATGAFRCATGPLPESGAVPIRWLSSTCSCGCSRCAGGVCLGTRRVRIAGGPAGGPGGHPG
jgi:hypothetical protein